MPDFIKVMDFGLVKDIRAARDPGTSRPLTLSASAALLGTPFYPAPEAISTPAQSDGRADLYALGAVAYFLLVGSPVFSGQTVLELCGHHLHAPAPRPSERAPVPPSLEELILRCLAKEPRERYATAGELLALERVHDAGSWSDADAHAWWRARGDALVRSQRSPSALAHAATAPGAQPTWREGGAA